MTHRYYERIYDYKAAIERYKLALYNGIVADFDDVRKAYICLRIAWLYRGQINEAIYKNDRELKKEAEAFLEKFKKIGEEFGVKLETEFIVGNPVEEIIKFAEKDDLIILALHEKTKGIDRFMVGSVSRDVVRNAPCSVFVVKSK